MLVKELMRRPYVVEKDISLAEAARIMSDKGIGSLVFVSGKAIKGILTEKDIIKNFGNNKKLSHAMTARVITIEPDEGIDKALEIMRKNKVKRLPVVQDKAIVGIVTLTDILANFEDLEEEFFF